MALRKILIGLLALTAILTLGACAYLQHPKFGALPAGERLDIIRRSPHFADGEFHNLVVTPQFADDSSLQASKDGSRYLASSGCWISSSLTL